MAVIARMSRMGLRSTMPGWPAAGCKSMYGVSVGTTFNGFVNERALPDGTTEVTMVLQTRDALAWVLATPGDPLQQEVLFGYLPPDAATGSPVA